MCIREKLYKRTQFAAVAGFLITSRSEAREPYHFHAFQGVRLERFVEKIGASHPQGGFEVIKITGFLITSRSEAREPYHFHAFQGVRPETFVEKIGASHPQGGFEVIKMTDRPVGKHGAA